MGSPDIHGAVSFDRSASCAILAIVQLSLLGSTELTASGGQRIEVGSRRQRQVLAVLGLHRGQVVDVDRLVDLVWGDDAPARRAAAVQTVVSRLRRLLTDPLVIETKPDGYLFECPETNLDLTSFQRLVDRLRTEPVDGRPDLAEDALSLWRGEPVADLDHPDLEAERQRLLELRIEVTETRAEALVHVGRHREALEVAEQLVRDHPYRERPVATLMRSLYATGRQADALATFADLRTRLLNDLGVDPSGDLRDLEMAILRQDLAADPPAFHRGNGSDVADAAERHDWVDVTDRVDRDDWVDVTPAERNERLDNAERAGDVDRAGRSERAGQGDRADRAADVADRGGQSLDSTSRAGGSKPPLGQTIRMCTTPDGTGLAYAVSGHGPWLVKAANWMTHLDYDWESPIWRHWNEGLSRSNTLLRYDERGCGLSDHEVDRFTFEAWVDDLASVVDAAGLDRFPLLGISQGGAVAIAYAVRHPERVSKLVLFGAYPQGRGVRAATPEQQREADLHIELARIGWGTNEPTFRQVFTSQFMPEGTQEQWETFNELQRRTCSAENAVRFMELFAAIDVVDLARQVQCPALIMHSRNELRVPFETARHLASLIPDGQLVPLESSNHILLSTEPAWQHFLAELDRFLTADDQ